jgi:hypothetical protein
MSWGGRNYKEHYCIASERHNCYQVVPFKLTAVEDTTDEAVSTMQAPFNS